MTTDTRTPVPFNDLARETRELRSRIDEVVRRVLDSGWFVMGPEHAAFEADLSHYQGGGVDTALVGNGTDALEIALRSLGVGFGSTVLTAANAGGYTSVAARLLGASLLYADVEPDSHLLSLATVQAAVEQAGSAPDVIVITHLYGAAAAETPQIVEWAHSMGISVLEDCAQALGAMCGPSKVGTLGDIATTSFYPTKNLGAIGDGGAVFTGSAELMDRVRKLRQYGWQSKYAQVEPGGRNSRMDELQAAVLRVKLPLLDSWNSRRRKIHAQYENLTSERIRFVNEASPSYVGHLAVAEVHDRDAFRKHLADNGVATDIHYPTPDHQQLVASAPTPSLPTTQKLAATIVSLPLFPTLTSAEVATVCAAVESYR